MVSMNNAGLIIRQPVVTLRDTPKSTPAGPNLAPLSLLRTREIVMPSVKLKAEPEPLSVDLDRSALVIIDMQRDFLEPGGFGAALGNDVSRLQAAVGPCRQG